MTPENTNGWVSTQQDGAVLTVTLDRPDQLNAQTPATWSTLAQIGCVAGRRRAGGRRPRRGPLVLRRAWTAACSAPSRAWAAVSASWAGIAPRREDRIRELPGGFPLAALARARLDRRRAGARHRRGLPARAGLRPADHGRRRPAAAARGDARAGPRPHRHQHAGRARSATPGRWRSPDRPRRAGRARPTRSGWPPPSSRPGSSTPRSPT